MSSQETPEVWNVSLRVAASIRDADGWNALDRLQRALTAAGFTVIDDMDGHDVASVDVTVGAFTAEDGTEEGGLPSSGES